VNAELIVELKAVEALAPVHEAQVLTYLRLTGIPAALLVNFHAETLKSGLRRYVLTPKNLRAFAPSCCSSPRPTK
jgi:GxxExxY protein